MPNSNAHYFIGAAVGDLEHVNVILLLLIQISIVIVVSRVVGLFCRKISQPLVIGEIVGGILLGPSFLGTVAPGLYRGLFPPETAPFLSVLAQVGLIFFMFLVGLELNRDLLRDKGRAAVMVSHASIAAPFCLGVALAAFIHESLAPEGTPFVSFALFMGAAMSITAFPVLARILSEEKLQNTTLGSVAITCAAVDDITAWCVLAFAISVVRTGSFHSAVPVALLAAAYAVFMFTAVRWFLKRVFRPDEKNNGGKLTPLLTVVVFVGVLCSAAITEFIGIHTVFGAFLFGAVMPKDALLRTSLTAKLEDFTLIFLMPVFFAYTGLHTQFNLLTSGSLWLVCFATIFCAVLGKFGGSVVAAKFSGMSWRESSALGVLMNTRGLMELIILNIGLSLGVISSELFAIMVIMALVTTFMTSPLLRWLYPHGRVAQAEGGGAAAAAGEAAPIDAVMVAVANSES